VTQALQQRQLIVAARTALNCPAGSAWFAASRRCRRLKPSATDWRGHPGLDRSTAITCRPLFVQLLRALCAAGWLRRSPSSRRCPRSPLQGGLALIAARHLSESEPRSSPQHNTVTLPRSCGGFVHACSSIVFQPFHRRSPPSFEARVCHDTGTSRSAAAQASRPLALMIQAGGQADRRAHLSPSPAPRPPTARPCLALVNAWLQACRRPSQRIRSDIAQHARRHPAIHRQWRAGLHLAAILRRSDHHMAGRPPRCAFHAGVPRFPTAKPCRCGPAVTRFRRSVLARTQTSPHFPVGAQKRPHVRRSASPKSSAAPASPRVQLDAAHCAWRFRREIEQAVARNPSNISPPRSRQARPLYGKSAAPACSSVSSWPHRRVTTQRSRLGRSCDVRSGGEVRSTSRSKLICRMTTIPFFSKLFVRNYLYSKVSRKAILAKR